MAEKKVLVAVGSAQEAKLLQALDRSMGRIKALEGAAGNADWQPIETAPKDGTPILTFDVKLSTPRYPCAVAVSSYGVCCDGWWGHTSNSMVMISPTHWMPLPASPSLPSER